VKAKKTIVINNEAELAKAFNLSPAIVVEWEVREVLNKKIIDLAKKQKITHAEIAKKAATSRTRVTALLNGRREDISTDLMLRVLACLGYIPRLSFRKLAG